MSSAAVVIGALRVKTPDWVSEDFDMEKKPTGMWRQQHIKSAQISQACLKGVT